MGMFGRMMSNLCGQPSHQLGQLRSISTTSRHQQYTDAADAAAAIAATAVKSHGKGENALQHVPGIGSKRTSSLDSTSRRGSIDVHAAVAAAERVASMTTSKTLPSTPEDRTSGGTFFLRERSNSHPSGYGHPLEEGYASSQSSPTHASGQRRSLDMHVHPSNTSPRHSCQRRSLEGRAAAAEQRPHRHRPGSPRNQSNRGSLDGPAGPWGSGGGSNSSSAGARLAARQAALAASWGHAAEAPHESGDLEREHGGASQGGHSSRHSLRAFGQDNPPVGEPSSQRSSTSSTGSARPQGCSRSQTPSVAASPRAAR